MITASNEELGVVEFHAVEHDREQQRREERDPCHRVCVCVSVCLCVLGTLVVVLSVRYTRIDPPVRCILGCLTKYLHSPNTKSASPIEWNPHVHPHPIFGAS